MLSSARTPPPACAGNTVPNFNVIVSRSSMPLLLALAVFVSASLLAFGGFLCKPKKLQQQSPHTGVESGPAGANRNGTVAHTVASRAPQAHARPGRVLLYFTTYPKQQHLNYMRTCWPRLLRDFALSRSVDVLVFLAGKASEGFLAEWKEAVRRLPVNATFYYDSLNPGYQPGAMRAMHVLVQNNWGAGFDWVIRLNPDVLIYDDHYLGSFLDNSQISAVFAACSPTFIETNSKHALGNRIMTDFFAVRPHAIPRNAFSDWATAPNAEFQATEVFGDIVRRGTCAYLTPLNFDWQCRIRGAPAHACCLCLHGAFVVSRSAPRAYVPKQLTNNSRAQETACGMITGRATWSSPSNRGRTDRLGGRSCPFPCPSSSRPCLCEPSLHTRRRVPPAQTPIHGRGWEGGVLHVKSTIYRTDVSVHTFAARNDAAHAHMVFDVQELAEGMRVKEGLRNIPVASRD